MALDYYVDSVSGDDGTGTGASGSPWKTIAKAISALATPVVDTTTIHLIGTLANPQTYDAANFVGVQCLGGAAVILKPDIFNISNYAQYGYPSVNSVAGVASEGESFGVISNNVNSPRQFQFGARFTF